MKLVLQAHRLVFSCHHGLPLFLVVQVALTVLLFPRMRLRASGPTSIGPSPLGPGGWKLCCLLVQVGCPLEGHLFQ